MATLPKYINVKNVSDSEQPLYDSFLPGGKVTLAAGEVLSIPREVYTRNWRKGWMRNVDLHPAETVVAVEEEEEPKADEVQITHFLPNDEAPIPPKHHRRK